VATCVAVSSEGLSSTVTVQAKPEEVAMTVQSSPPGLTILLDGQSTRTPVTRDTMILFVHHVSAPASACVDGTELSFVSWQAVGLPLNATAPITGWRMMNTTTSSL
jgi:hypothetical protein